MEVYHFIVNLNKLQTSLLLSDRVDHGVSPMVVRKGTHELQNKQENYQKSVYHKPFLLKMQKSEKWERFE